MPKALPDYRLLIAQPSSDQTYACRLTVYGYVDLSSHMVHLDYFKALVSLVDKDAPPCMYSIRAEDIAKLVEEALLLT